MMEGKQIIHQLTAHFRSHHDRIRAIELGLNPTGDANTSYVPYGTAGFRGRASNIGHLFYKVGLVAGLRCLAAGRSNLGIMITASHNPIEDNGVKIVDANGNMLDSSWESIVEKFCNIPHERSAELFESLAQLIVTHVPADHLKEKNLKPGLIMLGHDTRPSSSFLVKLVTLGLDAWAPLLSYRDYGQLTTPALHFLVGESTLNRFQHFELTDYYKKLAEGTISSFKSIANLQKKVYDPSKLVVDCANGAGSLTMRHLLKQEPFRMSLPATLINFLDDGKSQSGILNQNCGADFVKTKHLAPDNADQLDRRYASLDGDADRVVYFYLGQTKQLRLLDGDKILALFAYFLIDILKKYELTKKLTLGIVQTAYANGASTDYLTKHLGIKVDCVDTGVKHLHKKALDYDLGIYFEANGHGTIWVSNEAKTMIQERRVVELQQLLSVLNNYTGDAVSDVLIVELILNYYDWDMMQWDRLYEDRANSLIKVEIKNRELVQTRNAGRTCVSPAGLQNKIDELVGQYGPMARSFVRASGTENVVRIYAECSSEAEANELAKNVGRLVIEMCNT